MRLFLSILHHAAFWLFCVPATFFGFIMLKICGFQTSVNMFLAAYAISGLALYFGKEKK
jgi:hypothetical protein